MARRRKILFDESSIECLDADEEENEEDDLFINGEIDLNKHTIISSFNFALGNNPEHTQAADSKPAVTEQREVTETKELPAPILTDNSTLQTQAYGITPPVDGEQFDTTRTFKFRRSTIRLLNKLKAEDPDENKHLSTIVDEAIRHYYDYCFGREES